ncbi:MULTISPECIES: site-specific integrase [unclassified Streptomyces]|uniref:tyrosine-type recombinase/integrase n=1 Tax=unclassified Streptomyces TaxID=2593676 RepID=UPI0023671B7B|nr:MULTISPECIES: site-specific integrase [unclassified Streptomyces]MDF3146529.1 tyrosine-type recombinase/integrase [Streptomyces sp. T21Q-yed]WDF44673.1 tyrosine-type recombinase/integrase [Streptomyces sp. T12]
MANKRGKRRNFRSVRKLPSGRWQVRYRDPETGQLRPAEQTYASKTDAQVALTHIESDITRGQWSDPDAGAVNLGDYAAAWLRDRKLADRTRKRNESVMRLHVLPTFGAGSVADVTTARVRSWRGKLLAAGIGEPTVVKAYQLLRALMNTAVDDELIRRNPCRIKGADRYDVPERPVLGVTEVFAIADSIAPRYRLLVLLAAFTTLRFGELAALRRRDIDLEGLTVTVRRAQAELQDGRLFDKAPKSAAGVRAISFPAELLDDVRRHLEQFSAPGRDGHVFVGSQGGQLRRSNFRDDWVKARKAAGVTADLHFHDLRHTGNTLASTAGASTRELMTRMGHSSSRAALIYQHMTSDRDRAIADRLGAMIREGGGGGLRLGDVASAWH